MQRLVVPRWSQLVLPLPEVFTLCLEAIFLMYLLILSVGSWVEALMLTIFSLQPQTYAEHQCRPSFTLVMCCTLMLASKLVFRSCMEFYTNAPLLIFLF